MQRKIHPKLRSKMDAQIPKEVYDKKRILFLSALGEDQNWLSSFELRDQAPM